MTFRSPDRRAVTPQGRGRFPGYDVLDEVSRWDDVTAGVVLARLAPTTDLSFFTAEENGIATPLLDLLLGQDGDPRIPVVALIDSRLAVGETDGWHYDSLPSDSEAWRRTLKCLDDDAVERYGQHFASLGRYEQANLIEAVHQADTWHGMTAKYVWSLWTRYACTAFYSHPWAWNEIGFGGPAYPRGYKNLGINAREPWEVRDSRDVDPVPFAERVERAHVNHTQLLGRSPDEA